MAEEQAAAPAGGPTWGMGEGRARREERVYTNETCNQNCAFCDRRAPSERPAFVHPRAVRRRIDQAVASGAGTLVLTGGEPTLRRDLEGLITYAISKGVSVALETNAAVIDADRAAALAASGLTLARVHLPAWGEEADRITRDPGGFEAALAGARALAEAGIRLEVSAPIVRENAASLPSLPERLRESGLPIAALVVSVPSEAPDPASLLPLEEAAGVLDALEAAARRLSLPLSLSPHASLPPCLLPNAARLSHLFALTPGGGEREGHVHLPACEGCLVRDRCPGLPRARAAELRGRLRPIRKDHVRRRLSLISTVEEQIRRELYQDEIKRRPGEPPRRTRTVRIGFRCNQSCRFCFVSTHLPGADEAAVEAAIREAAEAGCEIAISGGEPTLHPRLVGWVRLAKELGSPLLELQTNATRLDDPAEVRALKEAGLDLAHVSLHASTAAVSDAITGAPGTFEKTLRGLDRLHEGGVFLRLSFVFCRANLEDFPRYVAWASERWPGVEIAVSFVAASTDLVPRDPELIPRYSEVVPPLAEGIRVARARGVRLSGFESMCGLPLCLVPEDLVPEDLGAYFALAEAPEGYDGGEIVDAEACRSCDLRGRCFGLRRGYAELHGEGELRPIRRG